MLELAKVSKSFGGLQALVDVSLSAPASQITSLIGPNGAGKSTLFNLISGVLPPSSGSIRFEGAPLQGKRPYEIVRAGIARTFQKGRLFRNLSVEENVETGLYLTPEYRVSSLAGIFNLMPTRAVVRRVRQRRDEILEFLGLTEWVGRRVADLPYGQQRLVEIGRALATGPWLLLLDEPAAGMNPQESEHLGTVIRRLQQSGLTILLIEHTMDLVMGISDHIWVLNYGRIIADGTPSEVQNNPEVLTAYLGEEEQEAEA